MQVALILFPLCSGVLFSFVGFLISYVVIAPVEIVYHMNTSKSQEKKLIIVFLIETISISLIIHYGLDVIIMFQCLVAIDVMSMIAYSDIHSGRIPIHYFISSVVIGIFLDFLQEKPGFHLGGGLLTFSVMSFVFWLGHYYDHKREKQGHEPSIFGFGDVYASGVIGFLFGVTRGMITVLLALMIAVCYAFLQSVATNNKPFLQIRIRLGLFFLVTTVVLVFFDLLCR